MALTNTQTNVDQLTINIVNTYSTFSNMSVNENELYFIKEDQGAKIYYATCATEADQFKKVATIEPAISQFTPEKGTIVAVKYDNTNTANASADNGYITLNINNTGDKNIYYNNTSTPTGTSTIAFGYSGRITYYMYDGTYWVWMSHSNDNNTTYNVISTTNANSVSHTTGNLITGQRLQNAITNRINQLDVSAQTGAANKTLTSISEIDGKISDVEYSDIAIEAGQITSGVLPKERGGTGNTTGDAATANGHTIAIDVPSTAVFTDKKVQMDNTTTSNWRKVLLSYSCATEKNTAVSSTTSTIFANANVEVQPSTGTLKAKIFSGSGAQLSDINGSNVSKVASATIADSANAVEWVNVANVNSIGNFNISHYNDNDTHFVPEGALEYKPSENPWYAHNPVGNEQYVTMTPGSGLMIISSINIGQQSNGGYANGETFITQGAKVGGSSALSNWRVIIGPHFGVTDDGTLYANKLGNSWIDVSSSITLTADTHNEITSISNKTFRYLPLFNLIFFSYDFYGEASANTSFSIIQSGYPPINTNVIAMSTEGDVPTSGTFHRYIKNNNPASLHVISVFETVSSSRFYVSGWYFCDSQ